MTRRVVWVTGHARVPFRFHNKAESTDQTDLLHHQSPSPLLHILTCFTIRSSCGSASRYQTCTDCHKDTRPRSESQWRVSIPTCPAHQPSRPTTTLNPDGLHEHPFTMPPPPQHYHPGYQASSLRTRLTRPSSTPTTSPLKSSSNTSWPPNSPSPP